MNGLSTGRHKFLTKISPYDDSLKPGDLVELLPYIIFIVKNGRLVYANKKFEGDTGYIRSELYENGFNPLLLVAPEYAQIVKENFARCTKGEMVLPVECALVTREGNRIETILNIKLVTYGEQSAIYVVATDTIKRSKVEQALELTRFSIDHAEDMIFWTGPNGELYDVNEEACRRHGYTRDEMLSMKVFDLAPLLSFEAYRRNWEVGKTEGRITLETEHRTKNGERFPIEVKLDYFYFGDREYNCGFVRDITERKKAETALKESRELLEKVFLSQMDAILVLDGKRPPGIIDCNPATGQIFGYSRQELLGKSTAILHVDKESTRQFDRYAFAATKKHGFFHRVGFTMKRKDGTTFPAEHTGVPLKDQQGNWVGWVSVIRDITLSKQAEEALRESEEKLRLTVESVTEGIIVISLGYSIVQTEYHIVQANEAAVRMYGYDGRDEFIGLSAIDLIAQKDRARLMEIMQKTLIEGNSGTIEFQFVRKDGRRFDGELNASVLRSSAGSPIGIVAITRDVTQRKQGEERLKALSGRYIDLLEEERKRIARELHDDTIQELLVVTHRLKDIVSGVHGPLPKNARERLDEVQKLIDRTVVEVRGFTQRLRPAVLDDIGLVPALRWLSDRITINDGLCALVHVIGRERRLQPEIQLAIFRIAQEALTNVKKHAAASTVSVLLQFGKGKVTVSVIDDGRGFHTRKAPNYFTKQGKFGLAGIAERVSLLGGTHKVESSSGKGTVIKVEIPTPKTSNRHAKPHVLQELLQK